MKSVIQREKQCLVCGSWNIEDHHIFSEELSEQYGLKVWLCPTHKKGTQDKKDLDLEIKELGQKAFEYHYGNRKEFIQVFGRNYL